MSLKRSIRDLLIMTKAERNGVLVLLVLIVIVIVIRLILPGYLNNDELYLNEIEQKIALLESEKEKVAGVESPDEPIANETTIDKFERNNILEKTEVPDRVFEFDPNSVTFGELLELGFHERVAHTLINYREKGGVYRNKADLLKVYGLDSSFYKRIEPYVIIQKNKPADAVPESLTKVIEQPKATVTIEMNSADSAMWTTLPGIGPVFAKRICSFRDYLGGFITVDQLKEVYNLPEETYNNIKDQLIIDTTLVKRINVNFSDINELKKHPYCNFELAKRLVDYRANHGNIVTIHQLRNDSVLVGRDYERLAPYLSVR